MKKFISIRAWLAGWLLLAVCGCTPNMPSDSAASGSASTDATATSRQERPLRIVVTIGMLADLVRQIGGEQVVVETLMGEGIDPHLYKPTRGDVQAIVRADAVFYCGLMLEGKMAETLASVAEDKRVYAIGDGLPRERLLAGDSPHASFDPHVWMDVSLWSQSLDTITAALAEFEQLDRAALQRRSDELRQRLNKVHEYGVQVMGTIPAERRWLVTSHDAFAYFGRAYGLEVAGVQGISTESEAGLQRINELVDLLVERSVPAVFVESSVPQKSLESIVKGAQSRGHTVTLGGPLFSDAMGPAGTEQGTYVGMMCHNFELIARGLGGQADPAQRPQ